MAFVWSFGIKFNALENAEMVKSQIDNIILSDGTVIEIYKHITFENGNLNLTEYTLELMLQNMQVGGNQKLLSFPYFYEIRDFFYQFLKDLDIDFCEALFEFEGSEKIAHENLIDYINQYGIGEMYNSNNFADLKVSNTIYQSKRILDGLVLSKENFEKLKKEYSEYFELFKNGYYWLPI